MRLQLTATVLVIGLLCLSEATNMTNHEEMIAASIFDDNDGKSTDEPKNMTFDLASITANGSNDAMNLTVEEEISVSVSESNGTMSLTEVTNALISALGRIGNIEEIVELLKNSTETQSNKTIEQQRKIYRIKQDVARQNSDSESLNEESSEQRTFLEELKNEMSSLSERVQHQTSAVADQKKDIDSQKSQCSKLSSEISNIKHQNTRQDNDMSSLSRRVQYQSSSLAAHKRDIDSQKSQSSRLSNEITNLKHQNTRQDNLIRHQQNVNSFQGTKLDKLATTVAFSAYTTRHRYIRQGATLLFDGVTLNHGGRFNIRNGIFWVPYDGIYHFEFNGQTGGRGALDLFIYQNNKYVARVFARKGEYTGSTGVIIKANRLDNIKIVGDSYSYNHWGTKNFHYSEVYGGHYCSFRGHLIARL